MVDTLKKYKDDLEIKKLEVESQDIDAYVKAKLAEIEPKIRAEATDAQKYEIKTLEIKIQAIAEAIEYVDKEEAVVETVVAEVNTDEDEETSYVAVTND